MICYCDDCQAFAHFLGRADETLDAHGGTECFQTSPARLEITSGADHLACVRLTLKGLLRWYAACCRTPIGNTLAMRQFPFVGLIVRCTEPGAQRDEALGPIRARLHTRFAKGRLAEANASERVPAPIFARLFAVSLGARLRGDHRRSPFFDAATGAPIAPPRVLTATELAAVRARSGLG